MNSGWKPLLDVLSDIATRKIEAKVMSAIINDPEALIHMRKQAAVSDLHPWTVKRAIRHPIPSVRNTS